MNFFLNIWIAAAAAACGLFILGRFGKRTDKNEKLIFPGLAEPYIRAAVILSTLRHLGYIVLYLVLALRKPADDRLVLALLDISSAFAVWMALTVLRGPKDSNLKDAFLAIGASCLLLVTWDLSMGAIISPNWWILPSKWFAMAPFIIALPAFWGRYGLSSLGFLIVNTTYIFLQQPAYEAVFIGHQTDLSIFPALAAAKFLAAITFYHLILRRTPSPTFMALPPALTRDKLIYAALSLGIASVILTRLPNFYEFLNQSKLYQGLVLLIQISALVSTFLVSRQKAPREEHSRPQGAG